MDAKSLAKSKRAHSLHHSKKHHPSSRATTAANGRKATEKLPSNWDRFDSDTEELPTSASDTVVPKSKGADFAHLISEAKSQSEPSSFACFADEVLNGIHQGPGALLFAEGQRLLSCISDYSFPFGEKETRRSQEESFFSLDLQSLAEQLSKASLVERLFIDPDVFPPELLSEYEATLNIDATETALDRQSSNTMSNEISAPTSVNQHVDDFLHSGSSTEKLAPDVQTTVAKRPSRFVATTAESELDMLLDSFSETKFFDPTSVTERPSYTSLKTQASVSVQDSGKGSHLANMGGVNSSLDESLDDLLKETSITKAELSVQEVNVVTSRTKTSTTQSSSKSKILDDFDSWFDSV